MKTTWLCQHLALHIKTRYINSFRSLLLFKIAWFCIQIPTKNTTEITFSSFKEHSEGREVSLVIQAHHFSHLFLQPSPAIQSCSTGEGQEVPDHLLPRWWWPKNLMWVRTANWSLRAKWLSISPYSLVEANPSGFPSRNQILAASSLNSHLCQEVQIASPGSASPG